MTNQNAELEKTGAAPAPRKPEGHFDFISEDGIAYGWAWDEARPDERVEVEFLVDGLPTGSTMAGLYRDDLLQAGIGDGCYSFSWSLPQEALARAGDVTVAARIKNTEHLLSPPQIFRKKVVANALGKIEALEHDIRLLKSALAQLSQRAAQDNQAVAALFTTVADFFAELAAASAAGDSPARLRPLRSAVADVTTGFAPFAFAPCAVPLASVFVAAAGPVAGIYETLRALQETLGDTPAEVYLLDDGAGDEAALLPLVVRNLRYVRLAEAASPAARCNGAMRLVAGGLAVFLAAGVRPAPFWTSALAAFARMPALAALAAQLRGPDGLLLSAGAEEAGGLAEPRGRGMHPDDAAYSQPGPVPAVAAEFFALRQNAWARLGGLDEQIETLPDALLAFCLHATAAGEAVWYEPGVGGEIFSALL
ncbi:MAG TPA: hypothetical protein PLY97_02155 [Acidocella sp.]|nr:MAG: hypothetical protein B7Z80_00600 [Rhodospirillales bacterium 20-64-7]HQT45999.1 hypothetical protein [Acidocella sp.]